MSNMSLFVNLSMDLGDEEWMIEMKKNHNSEVNFETHEKIIFGIEWLTIQFVGNTLLWGLIQFDLNGSDPMKRRITDQVNFVVNFCQDRCIICKNSA